MSNCFKKPDLINWGRCGPLGRLLILTLIVLLFVSESRAGGGGPVNNDELYKLLGVSKKSTTKEIRVAFKKLALEKHPDKNKDDPNANELFIKINRAYEILKDDDLRKKYDMFGEEGLKDNQNSGQNYQSWNFYKQNFGIYDDDPEIVTLSRSDFMQNVESNSDTIWFINFYSTQCSHCHELAPTWRDLARQLDGVVRIGAVNCMDDWMLCQEQQIQAFPSLIMYPKRARFNQEKSTENLLKFALSFASGNVYDLSNADKYDKQFKKNEKKPMPWLVGFCLPNEADYDNEHDDINYDLNCMDDFVLQKLAIMLHGLVKVATIDCNKLNAKEAICSKLKPKLTAPIVYYSDLPNLAEQSSSLVVQYVKTSEYKQIVQLVLSYLPALTPLEEDKFISILENLKKPDGAENPWLIQFVSEFNSNENLELKKLNTYLSPNYNYGLVDCARLQDTSLCSQFQIAKYPTFLLFKSAASIGGGHVIMEENWYEVYYSSRVSVEELVSFVKSNAHSTVRSLSQLNADFIQHELDLQNKRAYFVDFFAPWCPPCMNLLPEFRKASQLEGSKSVLFATVDCALNQRLCEQYGIRSYPTTMLFNDTLPHNYQGFHRAHDISDFVEDILKPSVINLNYEMFYRLVGSKPVGKVWAIDWFANWCGPCQQMAPEWRKMAKRVDPEIVSVGQVDCAVEQRLCMEQGINSYPNLRIYPSSSLGYAQFDQYQGWMRDANSFLQWVTNYMPSFAFILDNSNFEKLVLKNFPTSDEQQTPWLVDFYAPWCGHCQVFAPVFEAIAKKLEGIVKCGKVNCQEQQYLCQMAGIQAFPTIRFYKVPVSKSLSWQSGDNMEHYDLNSMLNGVNQKLKNYGYRTENVQTKQHSNLKSEL